jgi:hypothetical protein
LIACDTLASVKAAARAETLESSLEILTRGAPRETQ